jgi:predicted acyltransferase
MPKRLVSVDVFRGLTIGLMIIVNNPGSWRYVYGPLRHASWHGWTPTDMVFPFFLFIVGVAIALSFSRSIENGVEKNELIKKIIRRSMIIFALGLLLNGWPFGIPLSAIAAENFSFSDIIQSIVDIRIFGVLQRIALCYLLAALIYIFAPSFKSRLILTLALIMLYELGMRLPMIDGWGAGSFELESNFARYLDVQIIGANNMYSVNKIPFDPEGLLSTLTATVTTMLGVFTGDILTQKIDSYKRLIYLSGLGLILFITGVAIDFLEPINKQLWTVSYTLFMGGWAMILLSISIYLIDMKKWKKLLLPFIILGSNPIVIFVGSSLTAKTFYLVKFSENVSIKSFFYNDIFQPIAGNYFGSFLYAFLFLAAWTAVGWVMYQQKIFVKI